MKKSRLVISVIIGTIALSMISLSASLAWYASSDRLLVNTIDVDLRADPDVDLYISTKPEKESFKSEINNNDLNKVLEFIPTSSMFQNNWMSIRNDVPLFYDTSSDIAPNGIPTLAVSNKGFFQQKLYLLSNIDYYVTIDATQSFLKSNENANRSRAQALAGKVGELTTEQIEEKLNKLEKSMRLSILVNNPNYYRYYIIDPNKVEGKETYYAGRLDNNGDGYYDTYPVSADAPEREIIYGEIENRDAISYDEPKSDKLSQNPDYDPFKHQFFANSFEGKSKETAYTYNEQQSFDAGVKYKLEPSISLNEIESDDNPVLIPCYNGIVTEIVLSIYLEGWDLDCYNSTMGASFISTLSFKLLRGII